MFSLNSVKLLGHIQTTPTYTEETTTSQSRIWFKFKVTPKQEGMVASIVGIIGWDQNANKIAQHCDKGHELLITGILESRVIHTEEGFTTEVVYIVIEEVNFESAPKVSVPTYSPPQEHFDNQPSQHMEKQEEEYPDFQDPDASEQPNTNMLDALKELGIGTDEILNLVKKDMEKRREAEV